MVTPLAWTSPLPMSPPCDSRRENGGLYEGCNSPLDPIPPGGIIASFIQVAQPQRAGDRRYTAAGVEYASPPGTFSLCADGPGDDLQAGRYTDRPVVCSNGVDPTVTNSVLEFLLESQRFTTELAPNQATPPFVPSPDLGDFDDPDALVARSSPVVRSPTRSRLLSLPTPPRICPSARPVLRATIPAWAPSSTRRRRASAVTAASFWSSVNPPDRKSSGCTSPATPTRSLTAADSCSSRRADARPETLIPRASRGTGEYWRLRADTQQHRIPAVRSHFA
jgi:hypothetical protein